jgi:predicted dehydrogenase
VGWGFLGAGWIASRALAPAVHSAEGARLVAVASRDVRRAEQLGPQRGYGHYGALLDDPSVEAVYVALHNDAHLPWTLAALAAGKHVLCEKPLGMSAQEVATMAAAAAAADRLLVEATWSRWHPRTRRAQAVLASGTLGPVQRVEAGFTFPSVPAGNYRLEPERGGGALYDVGPYALGAPLWVLPDAAPVVEAVSVERTGSGVDATTSVQLSLGEARAEVVASIAAPPAQWLRIEGRQGTLTFSEPAFTSWLAPSSLQLSVGGTEQTLHVGPVDPYQLMVEHLSRAIRGDETAWVLPIEQSLRVASAIDLVRAAASA